jgi:hypothetical protein
VDIDSLEGEAEGIATVAGRKTEGSEVVAVSARLEAELTELPKKMPTIPESSSLTRAIA